MSNFGAAVAPGDGRAPIPILVMSYNDLASLRLCLRAIVRRTRRAYRLIVVDNASTDARLRRYLARLATLTRIAVHFNRRNLWVLGLNAPLHQALEGLGPDDFFAVSDCDIIVPPVRDGRCWLSRLESEMRAHVCIGKLGLSLDLSYLESRPEFAAALERERRFLAGPRIGNSIVAGVDTTMALYRQTLYVMSKPRLMPGHQSLHRPYYYCCRTLPEFCAEHLSWQGYESRTAEDTVAKLRCMALMGAAVTPNQVSKAPWLERWHYSLVRPLARALWGVITVLLQATYVARNFPRQVNEIQHARRGS